MRSAGTQAGTMPSMVSTIGGTKFGTPQKLTDTVGRLAGRLARGKGTQTKCVDSVAASFALSTKHRLLAVNPEDTDARSLQALVLAFDVDGERLLIGTAQGAVYKVDLLAFRFHLIAYVPDEITCLTALPADSESFVVAGQKNGHLFSVNQVTHERAAERPAHSGAVLGVCAAPAGGTLCSYSKAEAFVWRGGQLKKAFQLRLNSSALIVKLVFLSDSALLGAFGDDSVYVWCLETLQVTHEVLQLSRHRAGLADVAAAEDSDVFYAAGKSSQVFEFSLAEDRVTRIFALPDGSGAVARLTVFPGPFYGQILQVLLENGVNKFIHTETGHVVQSLGHPRIRIARTAASHSGLFLACLLATGHICLHHSTGDVFRRIVLPEAFYDSKPRVLLVDDSVTRKPQAPAAGAGEGRKVTVPVSVLKTPKRGKTPLLNTARLGPIVREQGEFPAQYRRLVWRHLLELPGAHALYVTLAERGQHPAWRHAAHRYPVGDPAVAKVLASTLSALAWWCPLFAEVEFLPYFVFPFCSVYSSDPLTALEMVITLLVNWCQRWFEFFPYPPISVLGLVENMLAHHCPELLKHYMQLGVTAHVYGWPLLETAFSEVFTQNDWLVAWDHILSNHPSFMLAVVVAYNAVSQAALMRCKTADDISYYFRNQNVVSVRHVVRRAYTVHERTPDELHARHHVQPFEPIGGDAYPVFNKYPTFIVNHQTEERDRIGREHQTFLEERGAAVQLAREMEESRSKQRQWADKLAYLKDAESAHREMLRQSEARLASQRRRLAALQRALQQRGRAAADSERSRDLLRQTTEKELLIGRLQDEIRKKRQESDTITQQLKQEEAEVGGGRVPTTTGSSSPPSPTTSATSRSATSRRSVISSPPPYRGRSAQRRSPAAAPLLTARSQSSSYGSPRAASTRRLSPSRASVPPVSPPRRRLSRSPPPDQRARAAAARAAARVVAARARRPLAASSTAASSTATGGAGRGKESKEPSAGLRRRSSLQSSQERAPEGQEQTRPAATRRVRMVPGTVDADIGELEREIDEIAADVATMARASGPADSEGDRFSSAHSVTTWTSRSAPDVSSLLDAPSLLPAHSSAQRVRQQLVNKWRDETGTSGSSLGTTGAVRALRPTRSQVQTGTGGKRGAPPPRHRRSRQTLEPRRQTSFRSML